MTQVGTFTTAPLSTDMVTELVRTNDHWGSQHALLCASCGWEGQTTGCAAPWPTFYNHKCKMRFIADTSKIKD